MKTAWVVLAIAVALALQTTLAHFVIRGSGALDLVLIVVVYVALVSGPVAGLLAGAAGGLAQDSLSVTGLAAVSSTGAITAITLVKGVIGVGGLAKTVVGFTAGVLGTQFIVTGLGARMVVFFSATIVHAVIFLGLSAILELRPAAVPYGTIVAQGVGNAVIGGIAFQVIEGFPGFRERRRAVRGRIGRRL